MIQGTRHRLRSTQPPYRHTKATTKPQQSHNKATPKPQQSQLLRLFQRLEGAETACSPRVLAIMRIAAEPHPPLASFAPFGLKSGHLTTMRAALDRQAEGITPASSTPSR